MTKNNDERLLSRVEASAFLAQHGYRVAVATLAKLACSGDGPSMTTFGRAVLYHPTTLLDWAERRSRIRTNTSGDGVPVSKMSTAEASQRLHSSCHSKKG
jgi:hypothetical protein